MDPGYFGEFRSREDAIKAIQERGFKEVSRNDFCGEWNGALARAYIHEATVRKWSKDGKLLRLKRIIVNFGA